MQVTPSELFTTWEIPPLVTCVLVLAATVYGNGWIQIRKTRPAQFPPWRLVAFLGGVFAIFVAVASPLDTFSESLLFMHMGQHFVLMSIAPPLLVLGAPVVPMLRGLPRWLIRTGLRPLIGSRTFHSLGGILTRPAVAWIAMNAAYVGWHIPAAYEFALSSEGWHNVEHACFLFTSILFWWLIVRPWPFQQHSSRWVIVPYLLLADIVNTGLSAFLCFCGRLIYPSYGVTERPFGLSALNDQIAAGAFMWVFGSMVFLLPVVAVISWILSPPTTPRKQSVEANLHIRTAPQLVRIHREEAYRWEENP
jgi:cytochrome c oxidase assembly factor CtaG